MGLNVLVVDDSAVMRAMIVKVLGMTQLAVDSVREAGDGQQGLARLHEEAADLLLLDINMPVLDGLETLERVRADPALCETPVLVVSTEGSDTRIEQIRRMGAGFMRKPFTPDALRKAMASVIFGGRKRRLEAQLREAACEVLEQMCFLVPDALGPGPADLDPRPSVWLHFRGPFAGRLQLACDESLMAEIATNMLGLEDAPDSMRQLDALRELANVICGNLLPRVGGTQAVFQVEPPRIERRKSLRGNADATVRLSFDGRSLDIWLLPIEPTGSAPQPARGPKP